MRVLWGTCWSQEGAPFSEKEKEKERQSGKKGRTHTRRRGGTILHKNTEPIHTHTHTHTHLSVHRCCGFPEYHAAPAHFCVCPSQCAGHVQCGPRGGKDSEVGVAHNQRYACSCSVCVYVCTRLISVWRAEHASLTIRGMPVRCVWRVCFCLMGCFVRPFLFHLSSSLLLKLAPLTPSLNRRTSIASARSIARKKGGNSGKQSTFPRVGPQTHLSLRLFSAWASTALPIPWF